MTVKLRCGRCKTSINSDDMLKHGIEVHNDQFAKLIQQQMDDLSKKRDKLLGENAKKDRKFKVSDIIEDGEIETTQTTLRALLRDSSVE